MGAGGKGNNLPLLSGLHKTISLARHFGKAIGTYCLITFKWERGLFSGKDTHGIKQSHKDLYKDTETATCVAVYYTHHIIHTALCYSFFVLYLPKQVLNSRKLELFYISLYHPHHLAWGSAHKSQLFCSLTLKLIMIMHTPVKREA